jgi:hypothetical protein
MLGYRSLLGIITGFPRISSVPDPLSKCRRGPNDNPIMNKNSQPEPEPASFEDARENVRDVGHTIMFASTGAGKSVSIAELLRTGDKFFLTVQRHDK